MPSVNRAVAIGQSDNLSKKCSACVTTMLRFTVGTLLMVEPVEFRKLGKNL